MQQQAKGRRFSCTQAAILLLCLIAGSNLYLGFLFGQRQEGLVHRLKDQKSAALATDSNSPSSIQQRCQNLEQASKEHPAPTREQERSKDPERTLCEAELKACLATTRLSTTVSTKLEDRNERAMRELWKKLQRTSAEVKRLGLLIKFPELKLQEIANRPPFKTWVDVRTEARNSVNSGCSNRVNARQLSIATFNLWNVNERAQERMAAIVAEFVQLAPDYIALQEVRRMPGSGQLQIDLLKDMLAEGGLIYETCFFRTHTEKVGGEEGHGVLSRIGLGCEQARVIDLVPLQEFQKSGPPRKFAHLSLRLADATRIDVISTHLGIFDREQCSSVAQLTDYIRTGGFEHLFVAGDFNSYFDFEHPMDFLTSGSLLPPDIDPCAKYLGDRVSPRLRDAFAEHWGDRLQLGHTFTNFDNPGNSRLEDHSRPDRVLFSSPTFLPKAALLFGDSPIPDLYFDGTRNPVFPSDHLGVFICFEQDKVA